MIYVKFNSAGKSIEMTNTKPETEGYFEVSDDLMGVTLFKEGDAIRPMTEEEIEESLLSERKAMATTATKDKALHLLKKSEYLVLPDAWESYTKTQKTKITAYRDFLKTIEKQKGFPSELEWPELPILKE